MTRLGLVPSSLFFFIGAYKQELLYLDRLAVSDVESSFETLRKTADDEVNQRFSATINGLREADLLEEFNERNLLDNLLAGKYDVEPLEVEMVNKAGELFELYSPFGRGSEEDKKAFQEWQKIMQMWLDGLVLGISDRKN